LDVFQALLVLFGLHITLSYIIKLKMQVVKEQSPVADNRPFLKNWDESVRSHYTRYESMKVAAAENLKLL
jgi:hypothetical protein